MINRLILKNDFLFTKDISKIFKGKTLILLLGASGSGKTELGKVLKKNGIPELISHTTREPRIGEIPNKDYYFINKEEFKNIEKIEHIQYADDEYCIALDEAINKLKDSGIAFAICSIDGVNQLKKNLGSKVVKVVFIEVDPSCIAERMRKRKDKESDIKKRIKNAKAKKEFDNYKYADYIVKNDIFENAGNDLLTIVNNLSLR